MPRQEGFHRLAGLPALEDSPFRRPNVGCHLRQRNSAPAQEGQSPGCSACFWTRPILRLRDASARSPLFCMTRQVLEVPARRDKRPPQSCATLIVYCSSFSDRMENLTMLRPHAFAIAAGLFFSATPLMAQQQLPNPAAQFCVGEETGQRGICILADGSEVDAWDHFRERHAAATTTDEQALIADRI